MIETIGFISSVLAVIGVLLNNRKMISCFYFWLISNLLSCYLHLRPELWPLVLRDIVFFILAIEGLKKWCNSEKKKM